MDYPRSFGAYVLLKSLGSGATGDVMLARPFDDSLGLPVPIVIKRLHGRLSEQGEFIQRFRHEALLATLVDSPHVAKVYDAGCVDETFYISMEYIAGWPLARLLKWSRAQAEHLDVETIADIAVDLLKGLQALHGARNPDGQALGIIHRDLSPRNAMVGEDGLAHIIDLGLGKSKLQEWKTATGVIMGSPGYMPPEQVVGESLNHRADLFSLGAILFELLTLQPYVPRGPIPVMLRSSLNDCFRAPSKLRTDLPPGLDDIVRRGVALDPDDRWPDAHEFAAAIRSVVPARPEASRMSTALGDILWSEAAQTRAEIGRLLVDTVPQSLELDPTHCRVFASRPGVGLSAHEMISETVVPDQSGPTRIEPGLRAKTVSPKAAPAAQRLAEPRAVPRRLPWTTLVLAGAIPAAVAGGMALERMRADADVVLAAPIAPVRAEAASGVRVVPRSPAPTPAAEPAKPVIKRRSNRRPAPVTSSPAAPVPTVAAEAIAPPSSPQLRARVRTALSAALNLRAESEASKLGELDQLIGALNAKAAVSNRNLEEREVVVLEQRLNKLK